MGKVIRRIPLNKVVFPQFTVEVLEDHGDWVLMRDEDGILGEDMAYKAGPLVSPALFQEFMLRHGGYVPYVDHNVPPNVSWDNFVYYCDTMISSRRDLRLCRPAGGHGGLRLQVNSSVPGHHRRRLSEMIHATARS